nr:hypothetical protein [Nocardioides sp. B-3]
MAIDETNRRRAIQGCLQHRARHRPAAAAQEDRRHHRDAGSRGREHPGAAADPGRRRGQGPGRGSQGRQVPDPRALEDQEHPARRCGASVQRPGRADPAADRPDARGRRRAAVRGRSPHPRRGQRAQEGTTTDDGGNQVNSAIDLGHLVSGDVIDLIPADHVRF